MRVPLSNQMTMAFLKVFFMAMLTVGFARGLQYSKENSDFHLKLLDYGDKDLRGCYEHSLHFKLCFQLAPDVMKLSSTNGTVLVYLRNLNNGRVLFQILDGRFLHRSQASLVTFTDKSDGGLIDSKTYQHHVREKLKQLKEIPEIQLAELLSAALGRQEQQIPVLPGFHASLRALIDVMDIQLSREFRATGHPENNQLIRTKRCLVSGGNDQCLGMCGYGCSCWSWVCGDCCLHAGCKQHDLCCRKTGFLSKWCLMPFYYGFQCGAYKAYPACLS